MTILYTFVSRSQTILTEFAASQGNFSVIARKILDSPNMNFSKNVRESITYDKYYFHFIINDGLVFCCLSPETFSRRISFAFLEDIKDRFTTAYGAKAKTAGAFAYNNDFKRVLETQMKRFSSEDETPDKLSRVKREVEDTKQVIVRSVEKLVDRHDRIEILVDRAQELEGETLSFKTSATQLQRTMYWKKVKTTIALVLLLLIVIWFIAGSACGGMSLPDCR